MSALTTLTPDQADMFEYAALEADLDIYPDYSGRGMYGRRCLGVVGSDAQSLFRLAATLAHQGDDGVDILTALADHQLASDNMGLQRIWYWPWVAMPDDYEAPGMDDR